MPLYADRATLRHLNAVPDIAPADDHKVLHEAGDLPVDGLFLGTNWHSLESEGELRWRWMDRNAEIVVTRPSGSKRALIVDLSPGPGLGGGPGNLQLRDSAGALIAETQVTKGGPFTLALAVPAEAGAIFRLDTEDGGRLIRGDPRVLNFQIFGLRWADPWDAADARAEKHAAGDESAPPADASTNGPVPLHEDRATLRHLNAVPDIAPADDHKVLHEAGDLPVDGLFLGANWHSLESDGDLRWRWMARNAEIVVTRPSGSKRALIVDLAPGPGLGGAPGHLRLHDSGGALIAETEVTEVGPVTLALAVPAGSGATLRLDTEDGGRLIPGDPRVLNFRVFGLRWADQPDGADASPEKHAVTPGAESAPPADAPTDAQQEGSREPASPVYVVQ
jgi:hypothetical protein